MEIIDSSSSEAQEQIKVTHNLLTELGCEDIPHIYVLNKCDKGESAIYIPSDLKSVKISALNKTGFDDLLKLITESLPETAKQMKLLIPYSQTALTGRIRENGKVISEEFTAEGTLIEALVDIKLWKTCEEYIIK